MSNADRKTASRHLATAIYNRYERLLTAGSDETAIVVATTDLAQVMYENVEFIIWALKKQGGLNPPMPERINKISAHGPRPAANDAQLPVISSDITGLENLDVTSLPCTCPPLEHGIIGRDKHMAACPKYEA